MGSLLDLRYCPSSLSTLRSMFAHQGPINKQLASKTVADNTWVHPHMNRTIVRASKSVLFNRVVHQASLPLKFVASRSLSLMLMSRRKVHAGFSVSWTCPQSMLRRAKHSWSTLQANRVFSNSRLVRNLLRPPTRLYHTQSPGSSKRDGSSSFRSSLSAPLSPKAPVHCPPSLAL